MNILIVASHTSGLGGTEAMIKKTVRLLQQHYQVTSSIFIYGKRENANYDWLNNLPHYFSQPNYRNKKIQQMLSTLALARYINKNHTDAILCVTPLGCKMADHAKILCMKPRIPVFAWPHIRIDHRSRAYFRANHVIAISSSIAEYFLRGGMKKYQVHLTYNPIQPALGMIARPEQETRFLYVGRLTFEGQKYLRDLLSALAQIDTPWRLDLVGSGEDDEEQKCQQFCIEKNIANKVFFHGWQTDPWSYVTNEIKQVSALVLSSHYEGFVLVIGEALSHGIFCVSSDCDSGPSDMIINDFNGYLYPTGDIEALKQALLKIINRQLCTEQPQLIDSIKHLHDDYYIDKFHRALKNAIDQ